MPNIAQSSGQPLTDTELTSSEATLGTPSKSNPATIHLDQLQLDLEKLLSACVVRLRTLRSKLKSINRQEERRKKRKKGKLMLQKQKKADKIVKLKHTLLPTVHMNSLQPKPQVSKVVFPKTDTLDKFWLSVESFCTDIVMDDMAFLNDLIEKCSQNETIKLPEAGNPYVCNWADEPVTNENSSSRIRRTTIPNFSKNNNMSFGYQLLEAISKEGAGFEKALPSTQASCDSPPPPEDYYPRKCIEERLLNEFSDAVILTPDELPKFLENYPRPGDKIVTEIKRCAQQLSAVDSKNVEELSRLREIARKDMERQKVKANLHKVENRIMNVYNKIVTALQSQSDDEGFDKPLCQDILRENRKETNDLIKEQAALQKELVDLTNEEGRRSLA